MIVWWGKGCPVLFKQNEVIDSVEDSVQAFINAFQERVNALNVQTLHEAAEI